MKEPSETCIQGVIRFDRKSQLELYKICFPSLQLVANKYFIDDEEKMNVINGSFIKIVDNIHKYENINFFGWIKRICTNESIDFLRQNKKYKNSFQIGIPEYNKSLSENSEIEKEIESEYLQSLLNKINVPSRVVFNLFAIDGYSHKEISQKLGISVETSKWHTKMARIRLREMVSQNKNDFQ